MMLTGINYIFSKACSGHQNKGKYRITINSQNIYKIHVNFNSKTIKLKTKQNVCVAVLLSKHASNFGVNKHTFTYVWKKQ